MSGAITPGTAPTPAVFDRAAGVEQWINAWLNTMASEKTQVAYGLEVRLFIRWLGGTTTALLDVDRPTADAYRSYLIGRRLSRHTINRKIYALRSLYSYAVEEAGLTKSPFAKVKRLTVDLSEGTTPGLSSEQLGGVLRVARDRGQRTYTIVLVLAVTGVRVSELLSMRIEDVSYEEDAETHETYCYRLVTRKGGRRQKVVIPGPAEAAIERLAEDEGRFDGPVIATRSGKPVDRTDVYDVLQRVGELANAHIQGRKLTKLHPHMLRVCATTTALGFAPLHRVQDMLGHSDPRTTRRYDRQRNKGRLSPSHELAAKTLALLDDEAVGR